MFKNINHRFKAMLIGLGLLIFFLLLMTNPADNRKVNNESILNNAEDNIIKDNRDPQLDAYLKLRDSINRIRDWNKNRLSGNGNSVSTPFFGVRHIYECDSCNSIDEKKFKSEYKNKYFIQLNGFTLKADADFFINKDKYFVNHIVWDRIDSGHPSEQKKTSLRYSPGGLDFTTDSALLIPISKKSYLILEKVVWVLSIILILFLLYTLYALPAKVLVSVASGDPFTKKNIKRLNITGWVLLISAILPPLLLITIEWIIKDRIPNEIHFPFLLSILDHRLILIAGLVVLLIANAFKRGYNLQQEQDLTI
jgi:hypothetical protein